MSERCGMRSRASEGVLVDTVGYGQWAMSGTFTTRAESSWFASKYRRLMDRLGAIEVIR